MEVGALEEYVKEGGSANSLGSWKAGRGLWS